MNLQLLTFVSELTMAYLPPAGRRCLTDSKLSYLPTMTEIQNPAYTEKMMDAIKKNSGRKPTDAYLIPLKNSYSGAIDFKSAKAQTLFHSETSHMRPFCVGTPAFNYRSYDTRAHCSVREPDLRTLPYGLPPDNFDVKIRENWFDHWKQENYVYTGAFQQWEKRFGAKYFYPVPVIPKPPRFNGKKRQ